MIAGRFKVLILLALVTAALVATGCKSQAPEEKKEEAKQEEPAVEKTAEKAPPETAEEGKDTPQVEKPAEPAEKPAQPEPAEKPADDAAEKDGKLAKDEDTPEKGVENEDPMPVEEKAAEEKKTDAPVASAAAVDAMADAGPKKKLKSLAKREDRAKRLVSNTSIVGSLGSDFGSGRASLLDGSSMGAGGVAAGGLINTRGSAPPPMKEVPGSEEYDKVTENDFKKVLENPLSTFSIDVDTAAYSNMRRFISKRNRMPPRDSVRIEEFINYFTYDYPLPEGDVPFTVTTELSDCPWNDKNRLAMVGLQGKRPPESDLPPSNIVFLIDSSGSMSSHRKMGLLKQGFKMLVGRLRKEDRVAIVTYAGSAGLVLPSTPGTEKDKILAALDKLRAGGSTAGAAGIELAYKVALKNFEKGGNNRVILASDGDFNVGPSSRGELERLIEEKRDKGVFLTILGFGMGNYKDSRMETLADKGNGNYAYIDDILEAKKVFVTEMTGTLYTIAKDVKIQIEFNPTKVAEYRLVGYENRMLKKEDFADDTKDAGELGAGHTVTALYELVPASQGTGKAEELKYVKTEVKPDAASTNELMTVKLRYKEPDGDKSKLIEQPVLDSGLVLAKTSNNFRWALAVAAFGQLLRESKFSGSATMGNVLMWAKGAKGEDQFGYRAEFIQLAEKAELLMPEPAPVVPEKKEGAVPQPAAAPEDASPAKEEGKAAGGACEAYSACCYGYADAMAKVQGVPTSSVDQMRQGCKQVAQLEGLPNNAGQEACTQAMVAMRQAAEATKAMAGFEIPKSCL